MVDEIESQIERFAPGFRRHVLARSVMPPRELESHNANLVGGASYTQYDYWLFGVYSWMRCSPVL